MAHPREHAQQTEEQLWDEEMNSEMQCEASGSRQSGAQSNEPWIDVDKRELINVQSVTPVHSDINAVTLRSWRLRKEVMSLGNCPVETRTYLLLCSCSQ